MSSQRYNLPLRPRFELSQRNVNEINVWLKEQEKKEKEMFAGKQYIGGAVGGALTYSFTPTSIGIAIVVRNCVTKDELDLSHYEDW
jgi:hypothetical protein